MITRVSGITALIFLALSGVANADDGKLVADNTCQRAAYDASRAECSQIVQQAYYFDARACDLCSRTSVDSDLLSCMRAVSNKTYSDADIQNCSNFSFGNEIVNCVANAGFIANNGNQPGPVIPYVPANATYLGSSPYFQGFSQSAEIYVGTNQGIFNQVILVAHNNQFIVDHLEIDFGNGTRQYVTGRVIYDNTSMGIYVTPVPGHYGRYIKSIIVTGRSSSPGSARLDLYGER